VVIRIKLPLITVGLTCESVVVAWNSLPPSVVNFTSVFKKTVTNANLKLFTKY